MESYHDYLEHREHKYIRKEQRPSGKWRYYYSKDSKDTVQRDKSNTQKSKTPHSLHKETDTHINDLSPSIQREKPDFKRVKLWIKRLLPKAIRSKKKIEIGKKAIQKRLAN